MIPTDRLVLRAYTEADRASFVALNTDPVVRAHMDGPLDAARADALFDRVLAGGDGLEAYAIERRADGAWLGHVFIQREAEGSDAELGFMLVQAAWGQGHASEAARALADATLAREPALRLLGTVDLDHPASARVLEKAGFAFLEERTDAQGPYAVYAR